MGKVLRVLKDGLGIFSRNGCFDHAAAISFYAFFSLIPLMVLITAALGFILGTHEGLLDRVIEIARKSLPYMTGRIINDLRGLATGWKAFGLAGLIFLLTSAEMVLDAMASSLSGIFGTEKRFGFFRRKVVNFFVLILAIFAALVSVSITAVSIILQEFEISFFGLEKVYYLLQSFAFRFVLPFVLTVAVIAVVYRILAGANLNFRYAFYGSLIFSTLWEGAKHFFAWYVSTYPSYNKFYGSLGALMVFLLWIFYSANIFLFSACLARAAYENRPGAGKNNFKNRKKAGAAN